MTARPAVSLDRELIGRSRMALDNWEARNGGPTSALTGSGAVALLEERFAQRCGTRYALALPTGTIALRVALAAAGVGSGDEVLIPALDWPAAAAAVLSLSARPRAVDTVAGSLALDPAAVAAALSHRTRAVVVTHLAGVPAAMGSILNLCRTREIPIIEDGSQALGAELDGDSIGSLGSAGVFSLGPGKLVDAGEGGILLTDDARLHREAVRLSQGPVRQLLVGLHPPNLTALAARIHPLAAILALSELESLEEELVCRREGAAEIHSRARTNPAISLIEEVPPSRFSWSCVPALVPEGREGDLASADLLSDPLGAHFIPELIGQEARHTPNADETLPLLRRLHPAVD
jgi:dTDP-4-amino-4,6-dideoxygalactose transaminase